VFPDSPAIPRFEYAFMLEKIFDNKKSALRRAVPQSAVSILSLL
jgi:hypothetical protein